MNSLRNDPRVERREFRSSTPYVGAISPIPLTEMQEIVGVGAPVASAITALVETAKYLVGLGVDAGKVIDSIAGLAAGWSFGREADKFTSMLNVSIGPVFFQYFPESIVDSRENEVSMIRVPSLSNPIPTFIAPTERTISFKVVFSQERWEGRDIPLERWDKYNFDVATAIQSIRAFTYPIGMGEPNIGITPIPLRLILPGTKIGINEDAITCILKGYDVEYVAFHPDGQPRLANMTLTFVEVLPSLARNITLSSFTMAHAIMKNRIGGVMGRVFSPRARDVYVETRNVDVSGIGS